MAAQARGPTANWKRLISKSLSCLFSLHVGSKHLHGRLGGCVFFCFSSFFAPFALVGLHKRGAGLLCAVGAARQREEQQTSGARSGFGALIGRLGKWGGSAQEPGTGTFSDMEAQSHISACTRHEAGSEPRSLFGQIR